MTNSPTATYERLKTQLKGQLADRLNLDASLSKGGAGNRETLKVEVQRMIQVLVGESRGAALTSDDQHRLAVDVIDEVLGLGPLDALLADLTITEIMVNGPHEIFIEREGILERTDAQFRDAQHLMLVIERILGPVGLAVNESDPICDASLPDGTRLNIVIPPLVLNGPTVTIRRKLRDWNMQEFVDIEALSEQAAEFLQACVRAKVNLIVSGGTSTGKTTLVSILSTFIPQRERIITIENVAELDLPKRQHWIRLVARGPNVQGRGEVSLRALVKNALRMRPDRIILGEARGGEALDVIQAMHTGHDGLITVLHGNSPKAALERLETLMLMSGLDLPPQACRMQIASAVDLVVHMGRFADGTRRMASVSQVLGSADDTFQLEDIFQFDVEGFTDENKLQGRLRYMDVTPKVLHKFQLNNVPVPTWMHA